ncbi:TonB-dependent receptor [Parasphingopyxis algicola]|uniref:TonB-dependent receptor n=1 Tax=Parasphingopyxis algicola TaxID=2026624 RepID=UPI0015A0AF17|nr:TonB-dependent receptor [Parasphingopyxis algicola]QLC26397.1 TonB-dependent receptor [Parasphingopyxis algicola]
MNNFHRLAKLSTTLKVAALATTALATTPAFAQVSDAQTDEGASADQGADRVQIASANTDNRQIVVTARRGAELLSDVPLVINLLDEGQIERLNIQSLDDVARFTPGLQLTEGSRPSSTQIAIRGLNVDVGRSSVALRIDGIDATAEAINASGLGYFPNQRLLDLERIEIVKGTQVALYGRSAFGGAVNFVSRRPDLFEWNGSINAGFNSEREYEVGARVNGPISEGVASFGLVAAYWYDGGSYRNQLSGDRIGGGDGQGVAASLLFQPTDNLTAFFRTEYSESTDETRPGVFVPPNTTITFPADVAAVINATTARISVGEVPDVGTDQVFVALDPFTGEDARGIDTETFTFTGDIQNDFGGVTLRSLTGYISVDSDTFQSSIFQPQPFINPDGTPNGAGTGAISPGFVTQYIALLTETEIFSQEIQLFSSDEDARFRWLVGGLYWEETIRQRQDQPTVIPLGEISTADIRDFYRRELFDYTRSFRRKTEHLSAFAWAEFDITDELSISVEGRYSNEQQSYRTDNTVNIALGFPGDPVAGTPPNFLQVSVIPNPQEPGFIDENYFTPKAVITYRPNDDLTLYASVARGIKPAGHSTGAADTFNEFTRFEAENLWSYELGVKSNFANGAVTANGAFFYQDYTDQQVLSTVFDTDSNVPRGATENAGQSRLYGVDLELILRPTDELTISGSYTYINTKFTEYEFFTSAAGTASRGPCVRFDTLPNGQQGCIISWTGNRVSQTPEHQFQIFANYTAPISDTFDFFIEPNVRYQSDRFLSNANLASAPAFWRVDLRAGVTSDNWSITAYIENLFDDDTPTSVFRGADFSQPGFPPGAVVFLPDPLTAGVNIRYSF